MKKNAAFLLIALSMLLAMILVLASLNKEAKDLEFQGFGFSIKTK